MGLPTPFGRRGLRARDAYHQHVDEARVAVDDEHLEALMPAAAITALASEEDRQHATQAGFQVHIAKPIDSARLASIVGLLADWKS